MFFSGSSNGQTEVKCGHVSVSVLEDRVVEGNETLELIAMSRGTREDCGQERSPHDGDHSGQ